MYRLADHGDSEDELEEANHFGDMLNTSLWPGLDEIDNKNEEPLGDLCAIVFLLGSGLMLCLIVMMVLDLAFVSYLMITDGPRALGLSYCYFVPGSECQPAVTRLWMISRGLENKQ